MEKHTIIKKTLLLTIAAAISRFIAFFREILMLKFLGVGAQSDAFWAAFNLPNRLRRLFAEGALSSVLIPEFVRVKKEEGEIELDRLTSTSFICIQLLLFVLCFLVFSFPEQVLRSVLHIKFDDATIGLAANYLKVLISFILFFSSAAIFAAALQSLHLFFIPAISPALLNVMYVTALLICWHKNLSFYVFCYALLGAAAINLLVHIAAFFYAGHTLRFPIKNTWYHLKRVFINFFSCIITYGCSEINFLIDQSCSSTLASGSYSLLRYAGQFANIPQSMLIGSFTTVVIPFFAKLKLEDYKQMQHQYVEAAKLVFWMSFPITLVMMLFSQTFFQILFLSETFTMQYVILTGQALSMYLIGLVALAFTRLLLNICYIYQYAMIPTIISASTLAGDYLLNELFKPYYGIAGIALATSIMNFVRMLLYFFFIEYKIKLHMDFKELLSFMVRYIFQVLLFGSFFYVVYSAIEYGLQTLHFSYDLGFIILSPEFFVHSFGLWIWVGPLVGAYLGCLYFTRAWFKIHVMYL